MSNQPESILVNSCQYTPVYLIQSPSGTQGSYVLAQSHLEEQKPVSDNLKRFYENSGILENCVTPNVNNTKPRILKKPEGATIGNNLKLASFLLPKNENTNKTQYVVNNIVLKSNVTTSNTITANSTINTIPKLDIDRKIVKLKDVPLIRPTLRPERMLPKKKPKENVIHTTPVPTPNPSKHTSVQLLKLGETYHSLNQLNDDQMKMVNQALKIFSDPDKIAQEPTYDPVTNTRFIYKVVSPRDLTVVGKKKMMMREKKSLKQEISESDEEIPFHNETKVTRSGRKVKLPKQILPEELPQQKPKKKALPIATCSQCYSGFSSLYRLQKHYEHHPTHIPSRIHSNLFQCLLAIIKSGAEEHRTNIFIQQLEQLIEMLKSLLPCLLKKIDGSEGKPCVINDDIGRLFGMNPGTYNLDVDALDCTKDKDGYCKHNPPKPNINPDITPTDLWHSKLPDEIANVEAEIEDCARINPVDKWPVANKRTWKIKQHKPLESNYTKRMRLNSENCDTLIDLGVEDLVEFSQPESLPSAIPVQPNLSPSNISTECNVIQQTDNLEALVHGSTKLEHAQFHSTHFDIRSSPMKPSSTVFHKFQINPDKLAQYQVQIIQPLALSKTSDCDNFTPDALQELLTDSVDITCKDNNSLDRDFGLKEWIMNANDKSDDFPVTNELIESSLYVNGDQKSTDTDVNHSGSLESNESRLLSNHGDSVLNFLESLGNDLAYPETEIRNNPVDFQLDLFSFHNS